MATKKFQSAKLQPLASQITTILGDAQARIMLTIGLMRQAPLHDNVLLRLRELRDEFNAHGQYLDFEILYEWQGETHRYIPDYVARMTCEVNLILEVKGMEMEKDRSKRTAAEKWVRAVNSHGGFGRWDYRVCRSPNQVGDFLESYQPK